MNTARAHGTQLGTRWTQGEPMELNSELNYTSHWDQVHTSDEFTRPTQSSTATYRVPWTPCCFKWPPQSSIWVWWGIDFWRSRDSIISSTCPCCMQADNLQISSSNRWASFGIQCTPWYVQWANPSAEFKQFSLRHVQCWKGTLLSSQGPSPHSMDHHTDWVQFGLHGTPNKYAPH